MNLANESHEDRAVGVDNVCLAQFWLIVDGDRKGIMRLNWSGVVLRGDCMSSDT